jgi:hypothetical protein
MSSYPIYVLYVIGFRDWKPLDSIGSGTSWEISRMFLVFSGPIRGEASYIFESISLVELPKDYLIGSSKLDFNGEGDSSV